MKRRHTEQPETTPRKSRRSNEPGLAGGNAEDEPAESSQQPKSGQERAFFILLVVSVQVWHRSRDAYRERRQLTAEPKDVTTSEQEHALSVSRQKARLLRDEVRAQGHALCALADEESLRAFRPLKRFAGEWFDEAVKLKQLAADPIQGPLHHVRAVIAALGKWSVSRRQWETVLRRHINDTIDAAKAGKKDWATSGNQIYKEVLRTEKECTLNCKAYLQARIEADRAYDEEYERYEALFSAAETIINGVDAKNRANENKAPKGLGQAQAHGRHPEIEKAGSRPEPNAGSACPQSQTVSHQRSQQKAAQHPVPQHPGQQRTPPQPDAQQQQVSVRNGEQQAPARLQPQQPTPQQQILSQSPASQQEVREQPRPQQPTMSGQQDQQAPFMTRPEPSLLQKKRLRMWEKLERAGRDVDIARSEFNEIRDSYGIRLENFFEDIARGRFEGSKTEFDQWYYLTRRDENRRLVRAEEYYEQCLADAVEAGALTEGARVEGFDDRPSDGYAQSVMDRYAEKKTDRPKIIKWRQDVADSSDQIGQVSDPEPAVADYGETYSRMTYDQHGVFDTGSSIGAESSFSQFRWATGFSRRRIDFWQETQHKHWRAEQDRRAKGYAFGVVYCGIKG